MKITHETIAGAVFIFERERGVRLSTVEARCIEDSGLAGLDPESIAHSLRNFVHLNLGNRDPLVASSVFALGKRSRPELKPFLVDVLRAALDCDPDLTYQILIAWKTVARQSSKRGRQRISAS